MKTIQVKDSEWYREAYDMPNIVTVYVNETKAEHDKRLTERLEKAMYDRENAYSGFDEVDDDGRSV